VIVLLSIRRERNRLSAIGGRAKADGGANLHMHPSERQLFRDRRLAPSSPRACQRLLGIPDRKRRALEISRAPYSFAMARSSIAIASLDATFAWFRQMRRGRRDRRMKSPAIPLGSHITLIGITSGSWPNGFGY
jgi:hypothetical protein